MNDNDTPWVLVALVALFVFYRISQTNAAVQLQQIASTNAAENNPWLTVPGAVDQGLTGISSLVDSFDNLFTSNSTTD